MSTAVYHQPPTSRQGVSNSSDRTKKRTSGSSTGRDGTRMIGQWKIGRTIGKGSSGRVKIAQHIVTGKYAAVKIVPKGLIISSRLSMSEAGARSDKVMLGIEREIVIMKLIDHPNVLSLFDVWETSSELYLIMEYVPGGELFDYLVRRGRLPVSEALHYFQQIIHAVDYCHRFNICHRDLKPENLLLDKDKNIKVADFGMAAWEAGERMLETSCGSPHYASPEIVAGKAYHGSSSDIWSCGIILFALLTGRLPFDDDNIRALLQKVKVGVFEMPPEIQNPARDLVSRMLEKDPEKRITMDGILRHPFFVSRPPRQIPGLALVSPPSLEEVDRPVSSPEDIDPDIMGNLKTLWHGASEEQIIDELMSTEKTWEKAIYHLLIKYRNKHLENYNMDEEEVTTAEDRKRRPARNQLGHRSPGDSPAKRKGSSPLPYREDSSKARVAPLGENETTQSSSPSPPSRPQAPTPKKAASKTQAPLVETSPQVQRTPAKLVQRARSPAGPRPISPHSSSYAPSSPSVAAPAITLQEATPVKEGGMSLSPIVTAPPRPISAELSPALAESPQVPPLWVPQVKDEQLQTFFNEVANQLNTMNIRSSVASNSSTNSTFASPEYQTYIAYMGQQPPTPVLSPRLQAVELVDEASQVDPNQFADADDDDTEAMSVCSHSTEPIARMLAPSPGPNSAQQASLAGLGLGGAPLGRNPRPGLSPVVTSTPAQRWSVASSGGSSQYRASVASPYPAESPGLYSPNPGFAAQFETAVPPVHPLPPTPVTTPLQAQRPAPPPPGQTARPTSNWAPASSDQQGALTESLLARDNSYVFIDHGDMPDSDAVSSWGSKHGSGFSSHRGADGFGMLKKKKKVSRPVSIQPVTHLEPASLSSSSPKRSWFNNLFSFKPASCDIINQGNIGDTRDKTRRLLTQLGVRAAIAEIEGLRALKCRIDDSRDVYGNVIKGVRFRAEFARADQNPSGSYSTLVSLTLEKGAQSTFKATYARLKQEFDAETSTPTTYSFSLPSATNRLSTPGASGQLSAPPVRLSASAPNSPAVGVSPRLPGSVQLPSPIRL